MTVVIFPDIQAATDDAAEPLPADFREELLALMAGHTDALPWHPTGCKCRKCKSGGSRRLRAIPKAPTAEPKPPRKESPGPRCFCKSRPLACPAHPVHVYPDEAA